MHWDILKNMLEEHSFKLQSLRAAMIGGDEAIESGESQVFNSAAELDDFFEHL